MKHIKYILKESIFGALFTLWTAPIDGENKLDIQEAKSPKKSWLLDNLIITHKS